MDYLKMRKNSILLPDLVIDNSISKCAEEAIEQKLRCNNHSGTGMQQLSKNIPSSYLSASSPSHESQPMSLPSSLPESASAEDMKFSTTTLAPKVNSDIQLKRPSQYTGVIGELRSIYEIPPKYRSIFSMYPSFNVIQSKALDIILYTDRPLVISAPTGSGKTAIFELAIVNLLIKLNEMNYKGDFKIVYMAPVKALCTERHHDWQEKFAPLGLKCHEVTGDSYDSSVDDLKNYNLVLTTPEKWDSLTRKWKQNKQLVQLVKLFLIDEVHLLNEDKRGPVLEAVVSRMKTVQETLSYSKHSSAQDARMKVPIRFIAVSATIPNIEDLADWLGDGFRPAEFLKVGEEYRPVKLNKVILGFPTSLQQNPFLFDMNLNYRLRDLLFKYAEGKPTLIFCSTRKGVTQTAQTLAKEITFHFNEQQRESLMISANNLVDKKLRDTILAGVGSHHAGMAISDRHTTEDLFRRLLLPVLVTTSTLAMGVNLPAHLVIVKSTQQYIGGIYQDYSETQLLQMIGRAGRPQFDKTATAVIMTRQQDKERYERLVEGRDLIESTLHRHLAEHLNSEVVLETITDVCIAMNWLRSTFLYRRALKNPAHYGFAKGMSETGITKKLQDLCLYEMNGLASANLVTVMNGLDIRPTDNGRLMASFYMSLETMKIFNKIIGTESLNDLILVLASSHEFSDLQLRRVEKRVLNELNKIKDRECIRFPIKGVIRDIPMKVNVLTQATFGCLPINDHSLHQDSMKIMRVGERISRCLTKFLQNMGHYNSLLNGVLLAKCYFSRLWENSIYVTKQLPGIGAAYSNLLASAGKTTFHSILIANPRDLERILNKAPPLGNELKKAVSHLPKYNVEMHLNDANNEGTMTLRLLNIEDISEFSTAGPCHWLTIIVGDNTNKVLHRERINDNQLIQMDGVVSWCFSIDSTDVNEIYGHVISDHWVGIDVQVAVTVTQVGRTSRNMMMKKAIEQYVSKMGLPNPLSDKKEDSKPAKPKKLTIVEQIRQKGRQLPELGVKIGKMNQKTPTPLKQTSLDRFLYNSAKKLKLPATYAQFISENGAVGKEINDNNFIEGILPPIYSEKQIEIRSHLAAQSLDNVEDSPSTYGWPLSCNEEQQIENCRTGERNQSRQDVYIQGTQPNHEEWQEQYSLNPSGYNTQEDALDDMEGTTINDQNNCEGSTDCFAQSSLQRYGTGECTRVYSIENELVEAISSEDNEEVHSGNTYQLEDRGLLISERREKNERKDTSSNGFHYRTESKKILSTARSESQKGQDKYRGSAFNDSVYNDVEIKQPSYKVVTVDKTSMLPTTSGHSIHRGLAMQNYRQTLHYTSYIKEDAQARVNSYSESQSEYLQRMKEHFADFKAINEDCDSNSKDEKSSFLARNHLRTENANMPTNEDEWYGGHDSATERNQSCTTNGIQDAPSYQNTQHGPLSVTTNQCNYKEDYPDIVQSSCSPQNIQENGPSQSGYQSMTECDQELINFHPDEEFSQQQNDIAIQDTQLPTATFCNDDLVLLKIGSGEIHSNNFNHTESRQFEDCIDNNECLKKLSQECRDLAGEEQDLTMNCSITFTQGQDDYTRKDGLHLENSKAIKEITGNNATDITDRPNALNQNEQRHVYFFVESTPDQRKGNCGAKTRPEQSKISRQEEVGQSQAGAQSDDFVGGDDKNSQNHSCQEIDPPKNLDPSDASHLPPEHDTVKENEVIKSPAYDSKSPAYDSKSPAYESKNTNDSLEKIRIEDFTENSEVPNKENVERTTLELKSETLNKKENCFDKHDCWKNIHTQIMKQEESEFKNETFDKEPQEKLHMPKHYFPIFINYGENMDQGSPKKKQEKLDFIFAGENCSPKEVNCDAISKITFDSSSIDIVPRRANVRPAQNAPSKNPDLKLNPKNISKLAFDLEIDSLLDSIDSTDMNTCTSNNIPIPMKMKSKAKFKQALGKGTKRTWDASDPLMVLFYGPREKKIGKLPRDSDFKAATFDPTNSTAPVDPLFVKPTTTEVQSAKPLTSETKNPNPKESQKNSIVISSKENKGKPAPPKKLFAYCQERPGASRDLERQQSGETFNIKDVAKAPKDVETSVVCQEAKKLDNLSTHNEHKQTQNLNSRVLESLNQSVSITNETEGSVPLQERSERNFAIFHQRTTQVNHSFRALPWPGVQKCNIPEMVQEMISCKNETFKLATNSGRANESDKQAQDSKSNSNDGKNNERFHEVVNAVPSKPVPMFPYVVGGQQNLHGKNLKPPPPNAVPSKAVPMFPYVVGGQQNLHGKNLKPPPPNAVPSKAVPMFPYVVGGQQNLHGKNLKPPPPNAVEIMNAQTQSSRFDQHKDQAHKTQEIERLPSNLSAHKVSTFEEVARFHETNSAFKRIVSPSKSALQKTFDEHGANQISNRPRPQAQTNTHFPNENSIKEGCIHFSTLNRDYINENNQFPSQQCQYLKPNRCDFEEPCDDYLHQNFDRMEPRQQTNGKNIRVIHPSPESIPDIFSSPLSELAAEDENDYDDIKESKFKWLDSQNTFTQRSDEDIFSSNNSEQRYVDEQFNEDYEFGSTKSQHALQSSSTPWNADSADFKVNRAGDLEHVDDLSESDIPIVAKKFEYNHTQTPRRISTMDERSSSKRMSSPLEEAVYGARSRFFKNPRCEHRFAGGDKNHEDYTTELGERKYQGVFEQTQIDTFKDSPGRGRNHKMICNDMKVSSVRSNVDSFLSCNQMKQQNQTSSKGYRDFAPSQTEHTEHTEYTEHTEHTEHTDKWSCDSQFQQLFQNKDIEKFKKYSREHTNQPRDYERENYERQDSSLLHSRADIETSVRLQPVELSTLDISKNLLDTRFYHRPTGNNTSKTPESIQRENMFQYCQKRTPGIIDTEFNLSRPKQRHNF